MAILLSYIDDLILTASSYSLLQIFLAEFKTECFMVNFGLLHYFLGVKVPPNVDSLFLNQTIMLKNYSTWRDGKTAYPSQD